MTTAGDELDAVSGSELYLDDMFFINNPAVEPLVGLTEVEVSYTIYSHGNIINLDVLSQFNTFDFKLYGLDGKQVWQTNSTSP